MATVYSNRSIHKHNHCEPLKRKSMFTRASRNKERSEVLTSKPMKEILETKRGNI